MPYKFTTHSIVNTIYAIYRSGRGFKELVDVYFDKQKAMDRVDELYKITPPQYKYNYKVVEIKTADEIKYKI